MTRFGRAGRQPPRPALPGGGRSRSIGISGASGASPVLWVLGDRRGLALRSTARTGAALMLLDLSLQRGRTSGLGMLATLLRVVVALLIALAWTVPVGVAIGTNRRVATCLQPMVQVTASVPATALFPGACCWLCCALPGGLNIAAVAADADGHAVVPAVQRHRRGRGHSPGPAATRPPCLQLSRRDRWRTLILPALFPYHHHRRHHRQRRRLECQHRGRTRRSSAARPWQQSASAR